MNAVDKHEHVTSSWLLWETIRGGRHKARKPWTSPIVRRGLDIWRVSWIGSTSKQISDHSQMKWYEFMKYLAYKWTIYRVKRLTALFMATFGASFVGYVYAGWG